MQSTTDTVRVFDALLQLGEVSRKNGRQFEADRLYEVAAALLQDEVNTLIVPRAFVDPGAGRKEWVVLRGGSLLPTQ
ncbi:MAG: hypothetical protein JNL62_15380 [Bryobacterales bacterium]|nr:hypothetical protein [Bryobacterales bacterium]